MINFDNVTSKKRKKHNLNCPQIPYRSYRIIIIGSSWSGKTKILLNLTLSANKSLAAEPGIEGDRAPCHVPMWV